MSLYRLIFLLAPLVFLPPLSAETATIEGSAGAASDDVTVTVVIDSDRDGLTDAEEALLGTDPGNADTDGDGRTDGEELIAGTNPLVNEPLSNPDSFGLPAAANTNLKIRYDFESLPVDPTAPFRKRIVDSSGFNNHGHTLAITLSPGITSKAAELGTVIFLPESFAQSFVSGTYTASIFFNFSSLTQGVVYGLFGGAYYDGGGFLNMMEYSLYRAGDDVYLKRIHIYPGNTCSIGRLSKYREWIWYLGKHPTLKDTFHHVTVSSAAGASFNGQILTNPSFYELPNTNPGNGGHFAVCHSGSPSAIGLKLTSFGKSLSPNFPVFPGKLDRFRYYDAIISPTIIQALANVDTDGDGINDRAEYAIGSDPLKYNLDADRDGLTNAEEVAGQAVFDGVRVNGVLTDNVTVQFGVTDPAYFDSDGDLFDDYWEAKYFASNVDPNNPAKPIKDDPNTTTVIEGDYDSDGLSNYLEMVNGTNPNNADTDGDGINDLIEAEYGSSPTDASEVPLNPGDFYGDENLGAFFPIGDLGTIIKAGSDDSPVVTAQVGDPSGSHSERWRLLVGDKQVVAQNFGQLSDPTKLALDPTDFHEIRVEHVGTDPVYLAANNNEPDYDYRAYVRPESGSPFMLCDLEGLLQDPIGNAFLNDVDPVEVGYKTAYLVPLNNFSWATSFSGGDAVGPRHRKVALNGRPIPDERPQQEEESDLPDEETFIDAFNLNLNHNTTFAYTPLGSSDLVLQAAASSTETGFSSRSGLRPHERFDLPFGTGWSSNLCSYVEVVETIGDESDDPVTVNVVDETGRQQRFGTRNFQSFFPWPSSRVDKKTYLNTLSRNGTNFTLQKKFGSTLTYKKGKTWFMYSTDRVEGSTKVRRHTYWRLAEARDRYGVRLQYDYDSAPGVPNDVSLIPRKISSPDREGQFLVIDRSADSRRVDAITDSRGNTTQFNYTFTNNEYAVPGGFAGAWKLDGVTYADGTTTGYGYESAVEQETDASDPQNPSITYHYHTNLKSVTDKRGNTHTFNYTFDQSKEYWDSSINGTSAAIDLDRLPADVKQYVEEELENRNEPGSGSWKTMYGMGRKITSVVLPGGNGTAGFASQGQMRFGETVSFTQAPKTTVTDAAGKTTIYQFDNMFAEIVDVDTTAKSVSAEWMVYYLTSRILHGGAVGAPGYVGTETYEFDPASGLSLRKSTDMSGNVTTWEFGEAFGAMPTGLAAASTTMTKWADPTAKIDALGRREEYGYGNFRVMNHIDDPYGTVSDFTVDALGRRKSKNVLQGGNVLLQQERYDYTNQRFKAFQTATTTIAFANPSGQAWETDLTTASLPDSLGRPWRQTTDPGGAKLVTENTYDFNNNKLSTLDGRGNRTRFKYDLLNRLTEITYPSAGTRAGEAVTTKQIWYDQNGNKAAEIDEEGNYTFHHYDSLNRRITTIRDMDGAGLPSRNAEGLVIEATKGTVTGGDLVTRMEYDAVGNVVRSTDPRGFLTRTFFDSIQRPIHVFSGLTVAEAAGGLAACTTAAAASTEKTHTGFEYNLLVNSGSTAFDSSGFKPTKIIRHAAVLTATGTIDLDTTATYDALYRPLTTSAEYESNQFATTTHAYGAIAAGKETRETTVTDARGKITRTLMDGLQRPTTSTDAFGTALASVSQTSYSSTGLAWQSIDPLGRVSETEYDGAARPVTAWMPDPITGLINRATPEDPLLGSPRTQTAYDKNSNVISTTNPLGQKWEYEYDARNRKTLERQPSVKEIIVVAGVAQDNGFKQPLVRTAYDGAGNPISTTDARGNISRSYHDKAYRVTATLSNPVTGDPSADPQNPGVNDIVTAMEYDPNGNVLALSDGNGNTTRNAYDLLNRLTKTATNPGDGQPNAPPAAPKGTDIVVSNEYDDSGNLVKVIDGESRITGFRYDGMSRKTRTLWDEGSAVQRIEQATFDGIVQLTRTDPKAQVTTYEYDALNRLEDILYTGLPADNRHHAYDLVGNLLQVSYPNETAARQILRGSTQAFDKLNRLTSETSAGAEHVHSYDKAGNRRTTNYAATARSLVNIYDKLNRLLTLTENGTSVTSYGYDLSGMVTRKTLPNGSASLCTFDSLGRRLTETAKTSGGGMISAFDYSQPQGIYPSGYDNVGNVLGIAETYGRADVNNRTVTNLYDRTYRLTTETIVEAGGSTVATAYAYDKNNNRTSKIITGGSNPGTWAFAHGTTADGFNSNQVKSVTNGGTVTSFLYDFNGNRNDKKIGATTVQTYGYDFENRLLSLAELTGTFSYSYDHRTRRVGRNESAAGGTADQISFAGGLSVQEYLGSATTPAVEYVRGSDYGGGIGGVLYTIRGADRSYNAYNSRGDVVSKTNDASAITWQAAYEAFGTRTDEEGTTLDRQKANTKDEDPTGLLNEGFRYRDLEFGIFLTRDPLGFVDGPNDYTYVTQNPWTFFDPFGLEKDKDGVKITRDGNHVSPVETWRDNDDLSPEVRERLDDHRVKPPAGTDAPRHGNSKAHIKYTQKVRDLQQGYIDDALKSGVKPSGLSGRSAKEFADGMVDHVMKDEYVSKFNSIISQGEGSTKNLNHMLDTYHKTGGKSGWSKSYKTASNWIGRGSKKLPIIGAIITTAGVAVAVSNAETAQQMNEALIGGGFDATPAGLVIDASGLRHVSALMDTGAKFRNDPNFKLNEKSDGSWGGNKARDLSRGMNMRKELMNE